jgi:diguanylate cyclase (GGDEF)-like protein/PAS domain S-box-containing protein
MRLKATVVFPFLAFIIGLLITIFVLPQVDNESILIAGVVLLFILVSVTAYLLDKSRLRTLKLVGENEYLKKREENSLASMFDSVLDLVFLLELKNDTIFVSSVNRSFLRITGIPKQRVIGTIASDWFGSDLVNKCFEAINGRQPIEFTSTVVFPSGEKHLETTIHPINHENEATVSLVVVSKPVSARNQTVEMLKETENHFQFITDNATDIIMKLSADSTFLYVSPIIEKILGIKPKDVLFSNNQYDFVHPNDHDHFYQNHQKMLNTEEIVTFKYRAFRRDNKMIWLESTGKKIVSDSTIELICITRDITERQLLENELMKANELLQNTNEKLEYLSYIDGLTNVGNRRKFDMTLLAKWKQYQNKDISLSLLMFDIDCFKEFNDTYGHINGDTCLKTVAKTVDRIVSEFNAELFRYGGEEFIILLQGATLEEARMLGNDVVDGVRMSNIPHVSSTVQNNVTVSVGIVSTDLLHKESDPNTLIDFADKALYNAKNSGKNQIMVYRENVLMKSYK